MGMLRNAAVLLALALGVTATADEQIRLRLGQQDTSAASGALAELPLLDVNDLTALGGFRIPNTASNGHWMDGGPSALAFREGGASADTLFILAGSYVAEIDIPTPVLTGTVGSMNRAVYVQGFYDPVEGEVNDISPPEHPESDDAIYAISLWNDRMVVSGCIYYDANNIAVKSHWTRPLTLSTTGDLIGPDAFWDGTGSDYTLDRYNGFTCGYMAPIPSAWQSALGGVMASGWGAPSVITRSSFGPGLGGFNPALIGSAGTQPHFWQPFVLYPQSHQTLGCFTDEDGFPCDAEYFGIASIYQSAIIIDGTRTAMFFGEEGLTGCYGEATTDPELHMTAVPGEPGVVYCYTLTSTAKANHGYPYHYSIWFYDLMDFKAVRDGNMEAWEVVPYARVNFTFPLTPSISQAPIIKSATYDPVNKHLYLGQEGVDQGSCAGCGVIWRFLVDITP